MEAVSAQRRVGEGGLHRHPSAQKVENEAKAPFPMARRPEHRFSTHPDGSDGAWPVPTTDLGVPGAQSAFHSQSGHYSVVRKQGADKPWWRRLDGVPGLPRETAPLAASTGHGRVASGADNRAPGGCRRSRRDVGRGVAVPRRGRASSSVRLFLWMLGPRCRHLGQRGSPPGATLRARQSEEATAGPPTQPRASVARGLDATDRRHADRR